MKKAIIVSTLLLMSLAGTSFAGNLDGMQGGIVSLSQGVSGTYWSSATTDATDFVISTGHKQGGYVYATGNFTTSIYRNVLATDTFNPDVDLITSQPASFDTGTIFTGTWGEI